MTFVPPEMRCGMGRTSGMPVHAIWPSEASGSTIQAERWRGACAPGSTLRFPSELAKAGAYPVPRPKPTTQSPIGLTRLSVCALSSATFALEIVQALMEVLVCRGVDVQLPNA